MEKTRNAKLRCSKCFKKYKQLKNVRMWQTVTAVKKQGVYVLCMCEKCDYVYISQSIEARRLLEAKNKVA